MSTISGTLATGGILKQRARKLALVGHAPSTRMLAPFNDPAYEIWTMNDAFAWIPRADVWFEIHSLEVYTHPARRTQGYLDHLMTFAGPVVMAEPDPRIPTATKLDTAALIAKYGNVFGSSFAWMIAYAVECRAFDRIELYGCDLASQTEYEEQRESTAFWIGYARGTGIDFYLPPGCPLLTRRPYGVPGDTIGGLPRELFDNRLATIRQHQQKLAAELNADQGRVDEFSFWRSVLEGRIKAPGVELPQTMAPAEQTPPPDPRYPPPGMQIQVPPDVVEQLARQLGMIRPGEAPAPDGEGPA